jgi:hypothetical protein
MRKSTQAASTSSSGRHGDYSLCTAVTLDSCARRMVPAAALALINSLTAPATSSIGASL